MTDDEQAIHELIDAWMAATKAGDVQGVLDLMTDDAVFLVPGQEPFGKEAFEEALQHAGDVQFEGTSDLREIQVLGDWAYLRMYLEVTTTPADGRAPAQRTGHTLTILRKGSDGRWRLARDANLLTSTDRTQGSGEGPP